MRMLGFGVIEDEGADGALNGHAVYDPMYPMSIVDRRARFYIGGGGGRWLRCSILGYQSTTRFHDVQFDDTELAVLPK